MNTIRIILAIFLSLAVFGCGKDVVTVDTVAERYVQLALKIGAYKPDYVDAYYGPEEWKPSPVDSSAVFPYEEYRAEAAALLAGLDNVTVVDADTMLQIRIRCLRRQLQSMAAMVEILNGRTMSFDEESQALYGVTIPTHDTAFYDSALQALETALPGEGEFTDRYDRFRKQFVIPPDKIDTVVKVTVAACRRAASEHIPLPPGEAFVVTFVGRQPWGAYNWYQGNYRSLMQIDTSKPLYVTGLPDLIAHEGYPGHHLSNAYREEQLLRQRNWVETYVQLLFSPVALVNEGTANYAGDLVFPREAKIEFIKTVLCPLAGVSPDEVERFFAIGDLRRQLEYAWCDAARRHLDGLETVETTLAWLRKYCLRTGAQASSSVAFFDRYRSYVINYDLGEDLTRAYIERAGDSGDVLLLRWNRYRYLLLDDSALMDPPSAGQ